jgi:hypothetical protein
MVGVAEDGWSCMRGEFSSRKISTLRALAASACPEQTRPGHLNTEQPFCGLVFFAVIIPVAMFLWPFDFSHLAPTPIASLDVPEDGEHSQNRCLKQASGHSFG